MEEIQSELQTSEEEVRTKMRSLTESELQSELLSRDKEQLKREIEEALDLHDEASEDHLCMERKLKDKSRELLLAKQQVREGEEKEQEFNRKIDALEADIRGEVEPVSYTHLTLPTKRIV